MTVTEAPTTRRQELLSQNVIHQEDHQRNRRKLDGLYGRVADRQNRLIVANCLGPRVLDVGAGYGNLTRAVLDAGMECVGIEIDSEKIALARQWYGVQLEERDIHRSGFGDHQFDTVVFREVIRHLRLEDAVREAARIAAKRIVVFQANPIWALRLANRILGHREHAEYAMSNVLTALEGAGFMCRKVLYSDCLAFPLSGGYVGPQLVPRWAWLYKVILGLDRWATWTANLLRLGALVCTRTLIVADRNVPETR